MKAPHPLTEISLLAPCSLLFNKLASISFAHINRSFEQKLGFCGHSQSCVPEMTQLMIFAHAEIIQSHEQKNAFEQFETRSLAHRNYLDIC